jgi:Protein of unknown function (DUF3995)
VTALLDRWQIQQTRRMRPHLVAATALSGLAVLHALWATGSSWPLRSRAEYTEIVTGNGEFPSPRACLAVAVLLGTGAVFVSGHPQAPPGLQRAGAVGVTAVLATRGALGLAGPLRVQRRVSSRGVTQIAGQQLRVGYAHRLTLVDIDVHETEFHIYDHAGEPLVVLPRTSGKEVTRTKGYGARGRIN